MAQDCDLGLWSRVVAQVYFSGLFARVVVPDCSLEFLPRFVAKRYGLGLWPRVMTLGCGVWPWVMA